MKRILLLGTVALWCAARGAGQPADTSRYAFPVQEVAGYYAANFGEIRTGHFHAGVDIKTDGVEGKPLVAVADGWLSRAVISTYGYGRALYLTLADGTTVVYGHLKGFRPDLADTLQAERYRRGSNGVDCSFAPDRWPVRRGEVIGYSGNSGSSGGPHLHFEVREAGSGRRLNLIRAGWMHPKDRQAPRILRLHYVEVDSVRGVCCRSHISDYGVVRQAGGNYRLTRSEPVPVGRRGYFVIEVSDRRDDVYNTFGIWRLRGFVDGENYFEYRMDGFLPDESRCSDAVSCYALQRTSRNEVIRMAMSEGVPPRFYPVAVGRGLVRTEAGEQRRMRVEVEDDCDNRSVLEFVIEGRPSAFRAQVDPSAVRLSPQRAVRLSLDGAIHAVIPAGALYEACFSKGERCEAPQPDSGLVVLSPALRVLPEQVPLRREATVSIAAEVPPALQMRAVLAEYRAGKGLRYVGGRYAMGAVTARTRQTGWLVVVADTLAPRIEPRFRPNADLSQASEIRFAVSDRFSGVAGCSLRIDGRWVPCDRLPMKGLLFHTFDTPPEHRTHTLLLTVTDAVGNRARWEGSFYR